MTSSEAKLIRRNLGIGLEYTMINGESGTLTWYPQNDGETDYGFCAQLINDISAFLDDPEEGKGRFVSFGDAVLNRDQLMALRTLVLVDSHLEDPAVAGGLSFSDEALSFKAFLRRFNLSTDSENLQARLTEALRS